MAENFRPTGTVEGAEKIRESNASVEPGYDIGKANPSPDAVDLMKGYKNGGSAAGGNRKDRDFV